MTDIQWNWANDLRVLSAIVLVVCVFQMLMLVSNYWHGIRLLRQEIEDDGVTMFADPPLRWTLAYHVLVLLFLVFMAVSRLELAHVDAPPTVATYSLPPLSVAMVVVLSKVQKYYMDYLRLASKRQHGLL